MSRFVLVIIIFVALIGGVFFGYELTRDHEATYAPETIYGKEDEKILLVNRLEELSRYNLVNEGVNNPIANNLSIEQLSSIFQLKTYISGQRPIVIFEKGSRWSKKELTTFEEYFKDSRTNVDAVGRFLIAYQGSITSLKGFSMSFFNDGDKKASGSIWNYRSTYEDWVRTDIYALENGLYNYQTKHKYKSHGAPIAEENKFTSVLPENIQKYEFFERFYAADKDSIFANGLMNEWVDEGYVKATFNNEVFLVTDNRMQQKPALILLERSNNEDSIDYISTIKSFVGFQLTNHFPESAKKRIYLLELEDKTIITETKSLAQKIHLLYNLGETISQNTKKLEQFFGELPKRVNYRYIDKSHKKSITVSDKIIFEVSTLPPGESMIMQQVNNWTKSIQFKDIAGVKPIKDHLRGGYSLFVYSKEGTYELLNTNGESVFSGELDSNIINEVSVVDIYSNDKHQLLFTTPESINLLDLNGNQVGHFPYKPHHKITSPPSSYTWKGAMQFLFATSNGELITVNNSGQELKAVQATSGAIYEKPYALNISGNLRGWFKNEFQTIGLAYLEKPIVSEVIGKSKGTHFQKINGTVQGWFQEDNNVFKESLSNIVKVHAFAEGKLINVSKNHVIIQKKNELFLCLTNGNLISSQKLSFNEVGNASVLYYNGVNYLGVFDYLENNFYFFNEEELIEGFPKEARKFTEIVLDKEQGLLLVYTKINNNIICYKHDLNQ